ncbi:MAG TPA: hypothetical protein VKB50_07675 [Vicinamibacterales bacterium]|nr:hypothetical protein [Vicinamibacterales bacterium]
MSRRRAAAGRTGCQVVDLVAIALEPITPQACANFVSTVAIASLRRYEKAL